MSFADAVQLLAPLEPELIGIEESLKAERNYKNALHSARDGRL